MRKRKTIKIDEKEITVKELTVQDILDLLSGATDGGKDLDLIGLAREHLDKFTDAKIEDLKALAPSEIEQLYDAFREVNAAFFGLADRLGLTALAVQMKRSFIADLSALAQSLLKPAT